MNRLKKLYNWQTALVCLIGLELVIFGVINSRFVNVYNLLYSVGDFLAFTLQFSPAHALPMMAGRLLSGLLAVVLCLKTTPKTT